MLPDSEDSAIGKLEVTRAGRAELAAGAACSLDRLGPDFTTQWFHNPHRRTRPSQKCLAADSPSSTVAESADTTTIFTRFCASIDNAMRRLALGSPLMSCWRPCVLPFATWFRSHCMPRRWRVRRAWQPDPDAFPVGVFPALPSPWHGLGRKA